MHTDTLRARFWPTSEMGTRAAFHTAAGGKGGMGADRPWGMGERMHGEGCSIRLCFVGV